MEVMMDMVWSGFITGMVPARHTVKTCTHIMNQSIRQIFPVQVASTIN
jgi:hypothetical protein